MIKKLKSKNPKIAYYILILDKFTMHIISSLFKQFELISVGIT